MTAPQNERSRVIDTATSTEARLKSFDCFHSTATQPASQLLADSVPLVVENHEAEGYKDHVAKTFTSPCGAWAVLAECESGEHRFAKKILCGKEWCSVCGEDDSAAHKRRQARMLPRMQQVKVAGYLVIEFPLWARHIGASGLHPDSDSGRVVDGWCYSKEDLKASTKLITDVLAGQYGRFGHGRTRQGGYFTRGNARWHWFGDKRAGHWNPHYNVLVDFGTAQFENDGTGFIPTAKLEELKTALREALGVPDLIVHYSYADTPAGIAHKVRYITRSTFRDKEWDEYMANELWNYRNVRWFGSWKDEAVWNLAEVDAEAESLRPVTQLQEGWCPDCGCRLKVRGRSRNGKPVVWTRPVDAVYLDIWKAQEIAGSGYYRLPGLLDSKLPGGGRCTNTTIACKRSKMAAPQYLSWPKLEGGLTT